MFRHGLLFILVGYIGHHTPVIPEFSKQFERLPPYHDITADAFVILYAGIVGTEQRHNIITIVFESSRGLRAIHLITGYEDAVSDQIAERVQLFCFLKRQFPHGIHMVLRTGFSRFAPIIRIFDLLQFMKPLLLVLW